MNKPIPLLAALAASCLWLSACGGGGGDVAVAASDVIPASAAASPEAFTQYASTLNEDDQREPLKLADLEPPTSETAEPAPVAR